MGYPSRTTAFRASSPSRTAAILAGAYAAAGALWIYFSDRLVASFPLSLDALTRLNTAKGWIYVAATGALLYAFIRRALERERALGAELVAGEERYRTLVEESLAAIYVIQDDRFLYVNRRWEELFGWSREEAVGGLSVEDTIAPEDRALVRRNLRRRFSGEADRLSYSFRARARDGRLVEIEVAGTLTAIGGRPAVIGTAVDRTELNRLQRESEREQKLRILGLLAGGVAHDVANVLHSITALAQLLETSLPAGPAREDAVEIRRCADRAVAMTRQILAFGRGGGAPAIDLDLNAAVRECLPMLRAAAGGAVALEVELQDGLGGVRCAPGQIEQVLLNLTVNARDAMPRGGRVRLTTRRVALPDGTKPRAELAVTDDGAGMDRATLERVFEPFFTTKKEGRGTGLGLPTVQRIAELAGGTVAVESEPGRGTAVRVLLPLV